MAIELLFLGTGTSAGIPIIACQCPVCCSGDPRDQRTRPSVLISYDDQGGTSPAAVRRQLLIDTAPEMRQQAIRHRLQRIDGVLYTHAHADHVFGMDDLRRFNAVMDAPIDIYAEDQAIQTLKGMFRYIFEAHSNINRSFVASLLVNPIQAGVPLDLFGARWTPLRLMHGRLPILGFRVDLRGHSLAYCTDVSSVPPESLPLLRDLDILVLDALRYRHHPTHMTVEQALAVVEAVRPRRAYFTHIAHDILHADLSARLPAGVELSYDGLRVATQQARQEAMPERGTVVD